MADLVVIVPSRGRPESVANMAEAFASTTTADVGLVFAVDEDDPALDDYAANVRRVIYGNASLDGRHAAVCVCPTPSTMVRALNAAAMDVVQHENPVAIAFLGDDHRPRTPGWDARYLEALRERPGLVYGNDLIQGPNLPTQVAMSTEVVWALGHMAPPVLTHLYVDNYWRDLGHAADCITYLPDVVIEHLHPVAGKAQWDAGYSRVNSQGMYLRDGAAYDAYWSEHGARDVAAVRSAVAVSNGT